MSGRCADPKLSYPEFASQIVALGPRRVPEAAGSPGVTV